MGSIWDVIAAGTYWMLIVLWTCILAFCLHRLWSRRITNRLVIILLIVLAIDAFRTVTESIYFGMWYASLIGYVPAAIGDFLTRPDVVIYPKLLNLFAAVIILFLVLRRWLPQEERELAVEAQRSMDLEEQIAARTRDWQDAVRQLEQEVEHQRVLMNELDHRVKNNLTSVITMVQLSLSGSSDLDHAQSSLVSRLYALSRAYESITESNWQSVSLQRIAERCVHAHVQREMDVSVGGPDVRLKPASVSSIGLVFDELTTNAIRHGALSGSNGSLRVTWQQNADGNLTIDWRERSTTRISPPDEFGFGLRLIHGLVSHDLHGSSEFRFHPGGLEATLTVPAENLHQMEGSPGIAAKT